MMARRQQNGDPERHEAGRGGARLALPPALLARLLDDVRDVVMIVGKDGRLHYANAAAAELLSRDGPLAASHGRLHWLADRPDLTLRRAIERACSDTAPAAQAVVMTFPGQVPLVVVVKCVDLGGGARHALLLAHDAHPNGDRLVGPLRECFGLTRSEAEVAAAIAGGSSIDQIAQRREVAVSTIRTQIKHISAKLGCTRQSQIAAIVKAVPLASHPTGEVVRPSR